MNNRINEMLATQYDDMECCCGCYEENTEEHNIDICIRAVSKPAQATVKAPFVKTDKITFAYTFNNRQLSFETEVFMSGTDEIVDTLIVDEDKRYIFMLMSNNKLVIAEYGNLENRVNFCKDVVQITKTDDRVFFLVQKEAQTYVNESTFKDGAFTHKIVSTKMKERDLRLIGTNGKFYIANGRKFYDKNMRFNLDYDGDFVHEFVDYTVVGKKEDGAYLLKLYENYNCISTLTLPSKDSAYKIKAYECTIVFYCDSQFVVVRFDSGLLEQYDQCDVDLMIYDFDYYVYNHCLFLTILTDKEEFGQADGIVNLSDKNDPKTLAHIKATSNLGFYHDVLGETRKEERTDMKKMIGKIIKGTREKMVKENSKSEEGSKEEEKEKQDRFKKYLDENYTEEEAKVVRNGNYLEREEKVKEETKVVTKNETKSETKKEKTVAPVRVTADESSILVREQELLEQFEKRMDSKIENAVERALKKSDIFKGAVLKHFVGRLEACINEIRIQAITEIREMKKTLLSHDTARYDEFVRRANRNTEEAVQYYSTMPKEALNDVVRALGNSGELLTKFTDDQAVSMIHVTVGSYGQLDKKPFETVCRLLLESVHVDNLSKKSLAVFSSFAKQLELLENEIGKDAPELFYLLRYLKKRIRKKADVKQ